jgi:GTPase SAR1 family protein
MTFDEGLEAIRKLRQWYNEHEGDRNEATTRFHLIDTLFLDCLGWSKDEIVLEDHHNNEYADYTFNIPRRALIVEAKREGIYFELPAGKTRLDRTIPVLSRVSPEIGAAIGQAARYCQDRGVPFGAIANGHQIVAFLASRNDAIPPLEGKALAFASMMEMEENFEQLWNALSRCGVQEKRLLTQLTTSIPSIPQKLSATTIPYPGVIQRNVFQNDLQILSGLILEDILPSPELEAFFLKECYSQSGQLSQFSLASKQILQSRYAAMFPVNEPSPVITPAVTRDGVSSELLSIGLARQPILLLGDVGVGKTTFVRNLIKVDAAALFENAIALHLNLGSQAALETDIRRYVLHEIETQLREEFHTDIYNAAFVRGVYNVDLKRFRSSIYGELYETQRELYLQKEIEELGRLTSNASEHTKRSLEHIAKGRTKQIVIFLDNADQRDESIQESAFLIAQEISQQWPALVFVSLRPETFNRSQKHGSLTGYHAKAFTISPPRVDQAILKRLRFALKITRGEIPVTRLQHVGIKLDKLTKLVLIVIRSLEFDGRLFELLENLSGGNMRSALIMLDTFIGSGHVDTQKMLQIYEKTHDYLIPPHEFIRAVIFGDSIHFDPSRSAIANIFDVASNDRREHFLLPLLIGMLERAGSTRSNNGFVEGKFLYDSLQNLAFTPDQIDFAVSRALDKKLIQISGRQNELSAADVAPSMRVTPAGLYHASRLAGNFQYIDAMIVDTPVLDDSVREKIRNAYGIGDRLTRVELFVKDYLNPAWEEIAQSAIGFDWGEMSSNALSEVEAIRWELIRKPVKPRKSYRKDFR